MVPTLTINVSPNHLHLRSIYAHHLLHMLRVHRQYSSGTAAGQRLLFGGMYDQKGSSCLSHTSSDNEILRRIAYVETRDGSDPDTYNEGNYGGIWAVSEAAFENTKDTSNALLALKHEQIVQQFGIDWGRVQFSELRKPLYSALAARLVLFLAPRAIPSRTDVAAQAQFWKENYNYGRSSGDFIGTTNKLLGMNSDYNIYDGMAGRYTVMYS